MCTKMSDFTITLADGSERILSVYCGDLSKTTQQYDIVVCSAFKNDYVPTPTSLIGRLWRNRAISVAQLAQKPLLDRKHRGYWLSHKLDGNFRHIGCVEIRSYLDFLYGNDEEACYLDRRYSMLRLLLEEMYLDDIPLASAATQILGTGDQKIDLSYAISAMISNCIKSFEAIPTLRKIDIYAPTQEKAFRLEEELRGRDACSGDWDVFISYSSKNFNTAVRIEKEFAKNELSCWMDKERIDPGATHSKEIPRVLKRASAVALVLTPEAQTSSWVPKEIDAAISLGCTIFPFQLPEFELNEQFWYFMRGVQVFPAYCYEGDLMYGRFADTVKTRLLASRKVRIREGTVRRV